MNLWNNLLGLLPRDLALDKRRLKVVLEVGDVGATFSLALPRWLLMVGL